MLLLLSITLFFSLVWSCSHTKFQNDRVIWIEYDEYWGKTYSNRIHSCDTVPELLNHYIGKGYELTHHSMAATESSYSSQKMAYSWVLVKK